MKKAEHAASIKSTEGPKADIAEDVRGRFNKNAAA